LNGSLLAISGDRHLALGFVLAIFVGEEMDVLGQGEEAREAAPAVSRRSRNVVSKSARFLAGLREGCVRKTRGFPAADRCIRNLFQPGTRGLDRANHRGRLAAASLLMLLDTAPRPRQPVTGHRAKKVRRENPPHF
jgi:hypothetical protein